MGSDINGAAREVSGQLVAEAVGVRIVSSRCPQDSASAAKLAGYLDRKIEPGQFICFASKGGAVIRCTDSYPTREEAVAAAQSTFPEVWGVLNG